jgi:hypothetical protein
VCVRVCNLQHIFVLEVYNDKKINLNTKVSVVA